MSTKKSPSLPLIIIAGILGWTIFKEFDVENMKFEKPALALIYALTFLVAVYLLVKDYREKS